VTSTTFQIDGGTLKANLNWHSAVNTDYMLENGGWAPSVPDLSSRPLAGRGPYEEIVEDRMVTIHGRTVDEVLENLENLVRLMDQAERYSRGEHATPVLVKYSPKGSSYYHEARILKRLPGDPPHVTVPSGFNEQAQRGYLSGVRLHYRRTIFIEPVGVENYAQNWSFEDIGSAAIPALQHWTVSNAPTVNILRAQTTTSPTHDAIWLSISGAAGAERGIYQDVTGLTVGAAYTFSADVHVTAGNMILRATDGGGALNPVSLTVPVSPFLPTTVFYRQSVTKVAPAGGSIRLWLITDASLTGFYTDGVALTVGPAVLSDIDSNTSPARIASEPLICSVGDHPHPSPIRAEVVMCNAAGAESATSYSHWPSYLVLTNNVKNIVTVGANSATISLATWTKPAAAGADQSYTGTLLRYTPVATTASKDPIYNVVFSDNLVLPDSKLRGMRVLLFLVCRASVANQFTIRGYASPSITNTNLTVESEPVLLTSTATTIVPLIFPAPLKFSTDFGTVAFQLEATSTAAAGTLDFDRVIAVYTTPGEDTTVVRFNESADTITAGTVMVAGRLFVDGIPTTRRQAQAGLYSTTTSVGELPFSTDGSLDLHVRGPQVAGAWIATGNARGATPGTYWQFYDSTNAFVVRNRLRVTRRKARVSPR
jgi:hypothetical protein